MVKWAFLTDNAPRTLGYTAVSSAGSFTYSGDKSLISVNGADTPITGDTDLTIAVTTYLLDYSAGANGSVTGTLSQSVLEGTSGTADISRISCPTRAVARSSTSKAT